MAKISIEDIREQLQLQGWELISDSYKNLDTELIYKCPEGHTVYGPWKLFRNKCECPVCKSNNLLQVENEIQPKGRNTIRILAIDQATHISGWSVFDNGTLVAYGKFQTTGKNEIERCNEVKMWLLSMIRSWRPDHVGLEGIQLQDSAYGRKMGVTVFETLAHLQGILMEACYENQISYEICPPATWRHHCGVKGSTRSDRKRSMQLLVKKWYDVSVSDDESDAIGLGKYFSEHYMKNIVVENWE